MATWIMAAPERRRAPRTPDRVSLTISDAGAELTSETKNLSAAGVYCTLDRFIPPMSVLELHFELPGMARPKRTRQRTLAGSGVPDPEGGRPTRIRCMGVVVRVEPVMSDGQILRYNTALFFTEISERQRTAISEFVRQRLAAARPTDD